MLVMTKIADMAIDGKNTFNIFFRGTTGLILMKRCMKHQRPKHFIFHSNYDHGLNLTCFMTRSNFATCFYIEKSDND